MIVDLCMGDSWDDPMKSSPAVNNTPTPILPDVHTCRGTATLPRNARVLNTGGMLQVGGLAHPLPALLVGRDEAPIPLHFRGCIKNLRVNGEVSQTITKLVCVALMKGAL